MLVVSGASYEALHKTFIASVLFDFALRDRGESNKTNAKIERLGFKQKSSTQINVLRCKIDTGSSRFTHIKFNYISNNCIIKKIMLSKVKIPNNVH